jgi:hypothetical protein
VLRIVSCTVICISRCEGAAAEETAQLVAEWLGFRLLDEEIAARAAVEAGVDKSVIADLEERKSMLRRVIDALGPAGMGSGYSLGAADLPGYGQPPSDQLRGLVQSAIAETAAGGKAVIVAHGGSFALASRDGVLRVLLTASPETRKRRIASAHGIDESAAERAVKRSDAARADYIKRFYQVGAELPTHYDVVINTDKLSAEQAARLIVHAADRVEASAGDAGAG